MTDTLSTLSQQEAKTFYEKRLLYRARQAQVFWNFATKTPLPKNGGNTVSWRRFNALSLATSALTEAVTPPNVPLSVSELTATVQPYGNYVGISDMLNALGIDPVMVQAADVMGQNAGESIEAVLRNIYQAGTSVIYTTGSARSSVGTGNPITLAFLRRAVATLDANNTLRFAGDGQAEKMGEGNYIGVVHPNVAYDIYNDSELKNALQYNPNEGFWSGSIGSIYGIRLYQTTLCPVFTGQGSGGANVYGIMIFGQNALGATNAAGTDEYKLIVKEVGSAGADDPLDQRGSVGWKSWQAPIVLNNSFMTRIECGATLG